MSIGNLNVHTNAYGLARSFIAIHLLIDLIFTRPIIVFPDHVYANTNQVGIGNFFLLFGQENRSISIVFACIILLNVIIGYLPQVTSILHAWIAHSFFVSSFFIEGGHQLAQIITFFLIPICLFDKRLNHWGQKEFFKYNGSQYTNFISYVFTLMIGVQMAVVYFFAVAVKINVDIWSDGSAIYYWLNDNIFGFEKDLKTFMSPIISNKIIIPLLTWLTLILESILFASFFMGKKRKLYVLILGIIFHFSIAIVHGLWSFSFMMFGGLILFLYPLDKPLSFLIFDLNSSTKLD